MSSANQIGLKKGPLNIIVVGASLTGLMHAIALRKQGHSVHVLEQAAATRESHMAGICLAADVKKFMSEQDPEEPSSGANPFCLQSENIQVLGMTGKRVLFLWAPRMVTSWTAFEHRLRALWSKGEDEYAAAADAAGRARSRLDYGCKVRGLERQADGRVLVRWSDGVGAQTEDGEEVDVGEKKEGAVEVQDKSETVDLVVGADGPNSFVRGHFAPDVQRKYCGYVTWRGVVQEKHVSKETSAQFQKNVTIQLLRPENEHVIVYIIPGPNGTLEPGERYLNWVWYRNYTEEELQTILTDKNGYKHRYVVPNGLVAPDVWQKVLDRGAERLAPPFLETMRAVKAPFLQSITDFNHGQSAYWDGRVVLVGDALTLMRPHTANSANAAAFDAMALERCLGGELDVAGFNEQVVNFGHIHWLRSIWWGYYYQDWRGWSYLAFCWYGFAAVVDGIRNMWTGRATKLRY